MGIDVMILPKLAAEENPAELKRKVIMTKQNVMFECIYLSLSLYSRTSDVIVSMEYD
jgi:hypothetical protein